MLHIYSCINSNSGGWLQLGCTEGQTKKYAEFQDIYCHAGGREHEAILSVEDWKTA